MPDKRIFSPLYYERPTTTLLNELQNKASGSVGYDAGWRSAELGPASGSLMFGSGSFVDGDLTVAASPAVSTNWSIGIDLGYEGSCKSLSVYDSGTLPGFFYSGSNASTAVYASYTNATWDHLYSIINPVRALYSGSVYKTTFYFPSTLSGRYFKLHAPDGAWKEPDGTIIQFTEITANTLVTTTSVVSGSIYNEYTGVPSAELPTGVTETEVKLGQYSPAASGGFV